jgi:hypothetical protein
VQASEDAARTGIKNAVAVINDMLPPPENIVNKNVIPHSTMAPYDAEQFAKF